MANALLGVTGSVAAILAPELYAALLKSGCNVKVVTTGAGAYFFDASSIGGHLITDKDEWPDRGWQRGDTVLHIELRRWADVLVIAPLAANTLAKMALGLCDNCLTCVYRAWDVAKPIVLAPAMNTLMWEHPATFRHLRQIASDLAVEPPAGLDLGALVTWINANVPTLRVVPPISKRLACDDVGLGAMASVDEIADVVRTFSGKIA